MGGARHSPQPKVGSLVWPPLGSRFGHVWAIPVGRQHEHHEQWSRPPPGLFRPQRRAALATALFVHRFRVTSMAELDDEFAGWLCEAYAVGQGAHLAG
jgi:hypothetical protein